MWCLTIFIHLSVTYQEVQVNTFFPGDTKVFWEVLLRDKKRSIPRGKIPNFTSALSEDAREFIQDRNNYREANASDQRDPFLEAAIQK